MKFSAVLDQGDESEFTIPSETQKQVWLEGYINQTGGIAAGAGGAKLGAGGSSSEKIGFRFWTLRRLQRVPAVWAESTPEPEVIPSPATSTNGGRATGSTERPS